jgi:voltage-gated potassium channel
VADEQTPVAPMARPRVVKALTRRPLTVARATRLVVGVTLIVTVGGGLTIWLLDHKEFSNLGTSLWWAVQTVTTVGYGDVVPHATTGRVIGTVVMITGIGFIAVMTAAVTASLIEQARRRQAADSPDPKIQLDRIEARLAAIERALAGGGQQPPSTESSGDRQK